MYCIYVPGAGTAVRLNSPLQAHTCKRLDTAADELLYFNTGTPADGQMYTEIFMEAYGLCVVADEATAGSTSPLRPDSIPKTSFSS